MIRSIIIGFALFAFACNKAEEPATHETPKHETTPLAVSLEGPSAIAPGDEITVKMTMRGHTPQNQAADVQLGLPAGITLLDGDEARQPMRPGETRFLHVRIDSSEGLKPLTATASIKGDGFGVTSRSQYRFGHDAPKLPQPKMHKRR